MSTLGELFAPKFIPPGYKGEPDPDTLAAMARVLHVDSLRYLPVADLEPCLNVEGESLCVGCVTGSYPSTWGRKHMGCAKRNFKAGRAGRTYEQ